MCTLFANTLPQEAMRRLFDVAPPDDHLGNAAPLPAIFPRDAAPTVRVGAGGGRELVRAHWGFPLPQASKRTGAPILPRAVVNARDDALTRSPFWRDSFRDRRALLPATAFCEPKGAKPAIRVWFAMKGDAARPPFAFAALWRRWRGVYRGGETVEIDAVTMITTTPNTLVATAHPDRMPAILPPEAWEGWLTGSPQAALALLGPYPAEAMRIVGQGADLMADAA